MVRRRSTSGTQRTPPGLEVLCSSACPSPHQAHRRIPSRIHNRGPRTGTRRRLSPTRRKGTVRQPRGAGCRRPTGFSRLLGPHDDGATVMERCDQPAPVDDRGGLDPVVVDGAVQLPTIERQSLTLVHAAWDTTVSFDPISAEEPESVPRVEVNLKRCRKEQVRSRHELPSIGLAPTTPACPWSRPRPRPSCRRPRRRQCPIRARAFPHS